MCWVLSEKSQVTFWLYETNDTQTVKKFFRTEMDHAGRREEPKRKGFHVGGCTTSYRTARTGSDDLHASRYPLQMSLEWQRHRPIVGSLQSNQVQAFAAGREAWRQGGVRGAHDAWGLPLFASTRNPCKLVFATANTHAARLNGKITRNSRSRRDSSSPYWHGTAPHGTARIRSGPREDCHGFSVPASSLETDADQRTVRPEPSSDEVLHPIPLT